MFDIHNHIIPGIDDGAQSVCDALNMMHKAVESGITHLVCTPHIHPGRFDNNLQIIQQAFDGFCNLPEVKEIPLKLAMSAEVRLSDELLILHRQQQLPFIGQWNEQRVLLLELPHNQIPVGLFPLLFWMKRQNIRPLIAHPERNKALMRKPETMIDLVDQGALLQITAASVTGEFGRSSETTAHWILDRKLVFCLASDAHNPVHRPIRLKEARDVVVKQYGAEYARQLVKVNPELMTLCLFGELHTHES